MPGSVERNPQREKHDRMGGGLLPTLAAAAVFPIDAVLAGMVGAGQGVQAICLYLGLSCTVLDQHLVRLGLTRPHDRPIRTGGRNFWKPEEITRLIAWRVTGIHPDVIGIRLGRTPGAVRTKARRLGLPRPARKDLRKVDPLSLQDPLPGLGSVSLHKPPNEDPLVRGTSTATPAQPEISQAGPLTAKRTAGQREMPFFHAIKDGPAPMGAAPAPVIPRTEAEIDLSGDLTWIGTFRKPQNNRLAVWAIGMLFMGGLYYKEIAARVGKTPASLRTLRTRCGVPVDTDRKNISRHVFDEEIAHATCALSGYIVKQCLTSRSWFWEHKRNRGCNASPSLRRRDAIRDTLIEGRSPTFTVLSREDLKSIPPAAFLPFAHRPSMVRAG